MPYFVNYFQILLFILALSGPLSALDFSWQIQGDVPEELRETIKNNAPLASKQDAVSSLNALCQLADNQTDLWIQELHSRAYFNAHIHWELNSDQEPAKITFFVDTGPVYPLESIELVWDEAPPFDINAEDLDLCINDPALPSSIIDAEENFLHVMALKGYPLAKISHREVLADQDTYGVAVIFHAETGPQVRFGRTKITGSSTVNEAYIWQQVEWKEGKKFSPEKIERTQENLESTGLFSSVVINEGTELDEEGNVPLEITLTEAKHRTIAAGVGYSTQQGPGITGEWQHRNFRGMGERLDVQTKIWAAVQNGQIEYMIPGFRHSNQDLRFIAEAEHEKTKGYTELSFSLSTLLDKRINDWTFLSYGLSYKELRTTHSDNNGTFHLIKAPVMLRWTSADDCLDPTHGMTFTLRSTPSVQISSKTFAYWTNVATGTFYYPLNESESLIFASKLTGGTIVGATRREIAPSERFYSGTENTLRGYRFMSVSPLDHKHKPIGGRSMAVLSTELRMRCTEKVGLAVFYEVGNVYADPLPDFSKGVLQSTGAGIRYNTPVGPIRFDVAVPLNRRKDIDPPYEFYMSIGQSF